MISLFSFLRSTFLPFFSHLFGHKIAARLLSLCRSFSMGRTKTKKYNLFVFLHTFQVNLISMQWPHNINGILITSLQG